MATFDAFSKGWIGFQAMKLFLQGGCNVTLRAGNCTVCNNLKPWIVNVLPTPLCSTCVLQRPKITGLSELKTNTNWNKWTSWMNLSDCSWTKNFCWTPYSFFFSFTISSVPSDPLFPIPNHSIDLTIKWRFKLPRVSAESSSQSESPEFLSNAEATTYVFHHLYLSVCRLCFPVSLGCPSLHRHVVLQWSKFTRDRCQQW